MSFPLNCNVARAAFGFCRFSPKEKITLADSTLDLVLPKESLVLCKTQLSEGIAGRGRSNGRMTERMVVEATLVHNRVVSSRM